MVAFLTCGHTRAALAAARDLGRAGCAVVVGAPVRPALAQWSRYTSAAVLLPDARTEALRFVERVCDEAVARGAQAVLPSTDDALAALLAHAQRLPPHLQTTLPSKKAALTFLDKGKMREHAESLSLTVVEAFTLAAESDIAPLLRELTQQGVRQALIRGPSSTAVDTLPQLRARLLSSDLRAQPVVVEPRPVGEWLAHGVVLHQGRAVTEVFQERIREQGDLSGVSTCARTVPVDGALAEMTDALLRPTGISGPVLVEYCRTPDGTLRISNVVPRLWGSVQLAVAAGSHIPRLAYDPSSIITPTTARAGVLWRWPVGEAELLWSRLKKSVQDPWSAGRSVIARRRRPKLSAPVHSYDVFAADDPMPQLLELRGMRADIHDDEGHLS
jgi:hypothetical protein